MTRPGEFEQHVFDVLWDGGELSVRAVLDRTGGGHAYTTILTVLDREGRIVAVESDVEPEPADETWGDAALVPGLVDLQVNGGNGAAFDAREPELRARAVEYHVERGTTSVLATLNNIGPGLRGVGPAMNFGEMPTLVKVLLSLFMILGRLEFYAVVALFMPGFWRR